MKFKLFSIGVFLAFGLVIFSSCGKENIDVSTLEQEEVNPEVVVCDLETTIAEQPPGSGDLFSNVTGGTPPYSYLWSSGETTANISVNTQDGTFTLTVTDAAGCVVVESISLSVDPCASFMTVLEENPGGELTATTTGGTAPYSYLWSTGETTSSITVTTDGTYSVSVSDASGCLEVQMITVSSSDPCASLMVTIEENPNGTLTAVATGGAPPYLYLWSTGETTSSITPNTSSGVFTVSVTDANGCEVIESITTSDPCGSLTGTIEENPGGVLAAVVSGGTAPFAYLWSTGETTNSIVVTVDGTYSVMIIDGFGCTITLSIVVGSNPCNGLSVTIAEQPPGSGALFTNVTGGTAPYLYLWSTGEMTPNVNVSNLPPGTFTITVTDVTGCVVVESIAL